MLVFEVSNLVSNAMNSSLKEKGQCRDIYASKSKCVPYEALMFLITSYNFSFLSLSQIKAIIIEFWHNDFPEKWTMQEFAMVS